ncbi:MAG: AbrB/MazE/SpoVT family DNA-binding domain-containing protein [Candidatus Woesearchaeota archaeon]
MKAKGLYMDDTNVSLMATEVIVKKWGNSLAVILPKEFVGEKKLKPNDKLLLEAVKVGDLRPLFGTLKTKLSAQKLKDIAREGWGK